MTILTLAWTVKNRSRLADVLVEEDKRIRDNLQWRRDWLRKKKREEDNGKEHEG